jgi:predicted RNase H-like HicB family nuclease
MTRQFDVVVERDSDGYFVASVPASLDFVGLQRIPVIA